MRISDWSSDVCSSDLLGHLAPDHLQAFERATAAVVQRQRAARDRAAAGVAVAGLGVADVGDVVVGEVRMQGDVAAAALSAVVDLGHALDVADLARSEERRVGKEGVRTCRSRWSPVTEKNK